MWWYVVGVGGGMTVKSEVNMEMEIGLGGEWGTWIRQRGVEYKVIEGGGGRGGEI